MQFFNKVQSLCQERGISVTALALALGFSKGTPTNWKTLKKPPRAENVKKIADYFGVPPSYFSEEEAEESLFDRIPGAFRPTFRRVPILGKAGCGQPIYSPEENEYALLGDGLKADFALEAKGDSMTGAQIQDGDIVYFLCADMVDNGRIAAVSVDGEVTLKRVYYYREENKLLLMAENPAYPPLVYIGEELSQIRILGLAVAHLSRIR